MLATGLATGLPTLVLYDATRGTLGNAAYSGGAAGLLRPASGPAVTAAHSKNDPGTLQLRGFSRPAGCTFEVCSAETAHILSYWSPQLGW